jgi:predicted nucleotidyltransferase
MSAGIERVSTEIQAHYGDRLVALALFGSRAGGRHRIDSDWDLLIVLGSQEPIRRSHYREWDEELAPRIESIVPEVSPHFVHLREPTDPPSSLWLEVAATHRLLHDPAGRLAASLLTVQRLVDAGRIERRSVYGLPYWRTVA